MVLIVKFSLPITGPPSLRERIAILYRNEHDMTALKEVFGNGLTGMNTVTSRDPPSLKDLLLSLDSSVRSCFIVVECTNMKEKLPTKSNSTVYQDLLKVASWKVGKNIFASFFFSLCSMRLKVLSGRKKETGRARETREGGGAWLPLACLLFLSPKYFLAPATLASHVLSPHFTVTVVPTISWICFLVPRKSSRPRL